MTVIVNIANAQKFHFVWNSKRCSHLCACTYVCVETRKRTQFFFHLKVQLLLSRRCSCVNRLLSFNEAFTELFQYQSRGVFLRRLSGSWWKIWQRARVPKWKERTKMILSC